MFSKFTFLNEIRHLIFLNMNNCLSQVKKTVFNMIRAVMAMIQNWLLRCMRSLHTLVVRENPKIFLVTKNVLYLCMWASKTNVVPFILRFIKKEQLLNLEKKIVYFIKDSGRFYKALHIVLILSIGILKDCATWVKRFWYIIVSWQVWFKAIGDLSPLWPSRLF